MSSVALHHCHRRRLGHLKNALTLQIDVCHLLFQQLDLFQLENDFRKESIHRTKQLLFSLKLF